MWHLIKLNNKRDKDKAEKELSESGMSFLSVSSLAEMYHSPKAIVNLLNSFICNSYLISDNEDTTLLIAFLSKHKQLFQKTRYKIGHNGHVKLTQQELDQFLLTLQIPEKYRIIQIHSLPENNTLKDIIIPLGPLQGLKGKYLNTKTPGGKRVYINVLNLFNIEIRIPIKDIKQNKNASNYEESYIKNQHTPHWYLLSSTKSNYITALLGDSINYWDIEDQAEPIITNISIPNTEETIQTKRYLYQAIYLKPTEDGSFKEINLMPHYYFFRTNRYDLETFRGTDFNSHIYIMRNHDGSPIQIPDKQMHIFQQFLKERSETTNILFDDYKEGDMASITMGVESNNEIEGTIQIVTKNHYILISENGLKINVRKKKK